MSKVAIIGSGFSGLSAAAYLSAAGHEVHVFEKNDTPGGRARQLRTDEGYVFDMGPSWYWMPDVFERFFNDFGHEVSDFYTLTMLDPSFAMVFGHQEVMNVPADLTALCQLFESIEKGSAARLKAFLKEAFYKYTIAMEKMVYLPGLSLTEFANARVLKNVFRMDLFSSFSKHVRRYFSHPRLIALMEFPILFLGAMPQETPAMYSLMNYAALQLKTWYPEGGFGKIIEAMTQLAKNHGTQFHFQSPVKEIIIENGQASSMVVHGQAIPFDAIIAAADYHHIESELLPSSYRNYKESYWEQKTLAPSCLLFYIGLTKKIRLEHHTLFFEEELLQHSKEIYKTPQWPSRPLFYACCPSKSDKSVAPPGHENLFLLMPIAPGLKDDDTIREYYFKIMMARLQKHTGERNLDHHIDFKKSYCISNFITDYHAYKGNAYGLANTLRQTALLKPKIRNKKVSNLFYAGQLTVPGPGVPPSLISGKLAAEQALKHLNTKKHEVII